MNDSQVFQHEGVIAKSLNNLAMRLFIQTEVLWIHVFNSVHRLFVFTANSTSLNMCPRATLVVFLTELALIFHVASITFGRGI